MIWFVFLTFFFRATIAQRFHGCRFMENSYIQATQQCFDLGASDAHMASNAIGNVFFNQAQHPADADRDFNLTIALMLSQQIYLATTGQPLSSLKRQAFCIPSDKRCSTMPMESRPKDDRFRSITGAWNNLKHPKWGKSFTPYGHLLSENFADGLWEYRKSVVGRADLPGARECTNAINKNPFKCTPEFPANHGSVMFGQLMAHDHGMRQMIQSEEGGLVKTCCSEDNSKPLSPQPFGCQAFTYTENDPFLSRASPNCNVKCMSYIRSQGTFPNDCSLAPHQGANLVSHYLDLSPVYGNTEETAKLLRTFTDGLLKTNKNNVLPETCNDPTTECYATGDMRGTGFFLLGILQSYYHRFHNIVARQLKSLNRKWDDERLYQESRRIVIACYQNHVIDWLRVFSGNNETALFRPKNNEFVGKYNPNVDASSTAEFSHSVFRVYHSNLNDEFLFVDANNSITKTMDLDECDVGLKPLETDYDDISRGMFVTPAGHASFTPIIRNKMFNNGNAFNLGLDLISTDLFIGRDLGLQPYHVYFEKCTGKKVRSWDDLSATIPAAAIADLKAVYQSVFDVDSYAGLALEEKCDSYLGTVGKCLVVAQYKRTVFGDRFFYSLSNGAYPFTKKQLKIIYNFSYSNLLCTVTGIDRVPTSGFEMISRKNPLVACQRGIDLSEWKNLK